MNFLFPTETQWSENRGKTPTLQAWMLGHADFGSYHVSHQRLERKIVICVQRASILRSHLRQIALFVYEDIVVNGTST